LRAGAPGYITDVQSDFGSSEYAKEILGAVWGYPPELELEKEANLQAALVELIRAGLVMSAHDCSDGGLAVALAEKAFPRSIGCQVNLNSGGLPPEFVLFGEDASRVVISCDPVKVPRIKEVGEKYAVSLDVIGETISEKLEIALDGQTIVSASVSELRQPYEDALEKALRAEPESVAVE
jgi:phosphoribosylformylglycinamidine synthase